jgi:hypothetical protein
MKVQAAVDEEAIQALERVLVLALAHEEQEQGQEQEQEQGQGQESLSNWKHCLFTSGDILALDRLSWIWRIMAWCPTLQGLPLVVNRVG